MNYSNNIWETISLMPLQSSYCSSWWEPIVAPSWSFRQWFSTCLFQTLTKVLRSHPPGFIDNSPCWCCFWPMPSGFYCFGVSCEWKGPGVSYAGHEIGHDVLCLLFGSFIHSFMHSLGRLSFVLELVVVSCVRLIHEKACISIEIWNKTNPEASQCLGRGVMSNLNECF